MTLRTCQPAIVPSDTYAYMTGEGGNLTPSPDALVWWKGSVLVKSSSRPMRTVSFMSLSRGRLGVDVSSSDRFDQLSPTCPTAPISDEVLSPTNNNVFAGSHPRIHKMNAPGGRNPGEGKYGGENFKFVQNLSLHQGKRGSVFVRHLG